MRVQEGWRPGGGAGLGQALGLQLSKLHVPPTPVLTEPGLISASQWEALPEAPILTSHQWPLPPSPRPHEVQSSSPRDMCKFSGW